MAFPIQAAILFRYFCMSPLRRDLFPGQTLLSDAARQTDESAAPGSGRAVTVTFIPSGDDVVLAVGRSVW